jgi:ABC-type branched-subunit amino acid transport system permease subunit
MSSYILFLILGLGSGATYAILGLGLVLKYRSGGVVDFAHGALAMWIAYVFVDLRTTGVLPFPWIVLPHQVTVSSTGIDTTLAVVISLTYAAVLGAILYLAVYRPLRGAAPLTRICASVGVMLAFEAVAVLNFGTQSKTTPAILPSTPVTISGLSFPSDRIYFTVIVLVLAIAFALIYRYTRFGLATRAGAENARGAALIGISADRVAMANYVIATVMAGAAGILIAPIANLDPTSYTLFIVPALGVALVGRFESFWIVAVAGILLGMGQSEIIKFQATWTWFPTGDIPDALPFILIITTMSVRARSVLARGETSVQRNPTVARPRNPLGSAAFCLVAGTIILFVLHGSLRNAFISSMTFTCVALSLVLLTGYVGQVSLAQMTFAGVGGFMLGHISHGWGLGFPLSLIAAGLCAVPIGVLIGLPALRLRGVNLAVVTLGAAFTADALIFNSQGFSGGLTGLPIKPPHLLGWNLSIAHGHAYPRVIFGLMVLIIVTLMGLLVARLRNGAAGRMLLAVRSNERAAASVGINVAQAKLMAFAIAAFIAGIGGALTGYQQGTLTSDGFSVFVSLGLLAIVYVAGIGRISGAVFAGIMMSATGFFVTFLDEQFSIGKYQTIVAGVLLVITAIANPDGVMSTSTGKGPAVAYFKVRDRVTAALARQQRAGVAGDDPAEDAVLEPERAQAPGGGLDRYVGIVAAKQDPARAKKL